NQGDKKLTFGAGTRVHVIL
uniref:Uncharacterized protein n=1 Tax=Sarcophilus harrisii TaxID=9305 RepID=A0A7N4PWP5_SARHA